MGFHKFFAEEPERRKWQNPEEILAAIGLKSGLTFVDVGCGYGFFTIPAAKLAGPKGKVYGIDVDSEAIKRVRQRASAEALENVILQVGEAEETVVCNSCADVIFFSLVLHDFDDPLAVPFNARKMIKSSGELIDLDWKKEAMEIGPPTRIRFSEQYAEQLISKAHFAVKEVKPQGPYHYLITAKPS